MSILSDLLDSYFKISVSAFVQKPSCLCISSLILLMIITVNCMALSCPEYDVALCKAGVSSKSGCLMSHNLLHTPDCKINEMKTYKIKCLMLMLCSERVSRADGVSGSEQPLPQITKQGTSARGRYGACPEGCSDRQQGEAVEG